jgi:fatty acid desaturase
MYNHCREYMIADDAKAWWQLISTALLFFPLVGAMLWLNPLVQPFALILAIPAGGLLTRFFALQHDCGHGSFFSSKRTNEIVGQLLSVLTFTPYDHWRKSHAQHHAGSGNLDRRGIGDVETITVQEFEKLSPMGKFHYRVMRHPFIALFIGPPDSATPGYWFEYGPSRRLARFNDPQLSFTCVLWVSVLVARPVAGSRRCCTFSHSWRLDWWLAVFRAAPV